MTGFPVTIEREKAFYSRILEWERNNGPKKLLHWLLDLDLEGWTPPASAPMTAEKYMAYIENLSPIQMLAEEMTTANENIVKMWCDGAMEWAEQAQYDDRQAVRAKEISDSLSRLQVRPFYSPDELAMLFPAIVEQMQGIRKMNTHAGEISRQLRE